MPPLHPKKKLHIVIDAAALAEIIGITERAGAKGYTVVPHVTGSGHRGVRRGHDIFEEAQNVIVIILADEPIILRILDDVMVLLESYAGIAYASDVQVARPDYF